MNFDAIELAQGAHPNRCDTDGNVTVCAMELVAWLCDEKHTDHPECVSPEIGAYIRVLNDAMPADPRQRLKPFLPRTMNTQGDGKVQERLYAMADAAVRVFAANALDSAGLTLEANALRVLAPIVDAESAESAAWSAESAAAGSAESEGSAAAWSAAWSARSAAAWSAESAAAGSAESAELAGSAAESAARSAARSAAWDDALALLDRILP